eukprot:gene8208-9088_t
MEESKTNPTVEEPSSTNCCNKITDFIVGKFESAFFILGRAIGRSPYITILIAIVVAALCGIGMLRFTQENRGEKLWSPQDSEALANKAVTGQRFPVASRINVVIFESSNVLTSQVLKAMIELDKKIKNISSGTESEWDKICFRQGSHCGVSSLLEIWEFNQTTINSLTDADIIDALNKSPLISPVTKRPIAIDRKLGAIQRNSTNHIIAAGAVSSTYFIKNQAVFDKKSGAEHLILTGFRASIMSAYFHGPDTVGNININQGSHGTYTVCKCDEDEKGKAWEQEFGKSVKSIDKQYSFAKLFFYTRTSFREASGSTISGDLTLLSTGYILIIVYLAIMLGRFTRLHHKVWLAVIGVLCVGLSILVSFGLSSAFGFFYGPVHSILPFLILGIGVDDVFVIIQSYENTVKKLPSDSSLPYVLAATMKHAGVAISVTSMTDVIAFLIGATTLLPALRSFCVYAGLGILAVFFFACTIFTACLALDIKRERNRKDACCCCVRVSDNYNPFNCAKTDHLQSFFEKVLAPFMMKWPAKVFLLLVTAGLFAGGCYGTVKLEQNFDFNLFLPPDSDATRYNKIVAKVRSIRGSTSIHYGLIQYFPNEGVQFTINIGDVNYFKEQPCLHDVYLKTYQNQYVVKSSVTSWYEKYTQWISSTYTNNTYVGSGKAYFDVHLIPVGGRPTNETLFYDWLVIFLNSQSGASFRTDVKLSNSTGSWRILYSRMHATHTKMKNSPAEVKAMDSIRAAMKSIPFSKPAFAYARVYVGWETNKIIGEELFRNLGLAAACVFLVTLFLIANLWTSLMVFTCVVFTLADVAGFMHFWGLTIDTVTSVMLILAIGLCVDYAAHIGHAFMTANLRTRNERASSALTEIGPAVLNGGFSTFLAFVCLAFSSSYIFKSFFKVFFLVVLFGLFHGLIYFPTLLSLIGPKAYSTKILKEDSEVSGSNNNVGNNRQQSIGNQVASNGHIEMQNQGFQSGEDTLDKA